MEKSKKDDTPWTTLKYLIGEIIYGGKVIDAYDRRILLAYVEEYFGDFIYSSYQPFTFYNCKDGSLSSKYIEIERKILEHDCRQINLEGEF